MNNMDCSSARKALHRRLHYLRILSTSAGCAGGIGLAGFLSSMTQSVMIIPPFGATCVIATVTPDSAFAQPRSILGGHFLSSLVGLACAAYLGTSWWAFAIAVGFAVMLMQLSHTLHPPAAADPIFFIMQGHITGKYIVMSVLLSCVVLIVFFYAFHRWATKRPYPRYWY